MRTALAFALFGALGDLEVIRADQPTFAVHEFEYFEEPSVLYASSILAPTTTRSYGPVSSDATKYLDTTLSTTIWGNWLPSQTVITATDTADPYGQAAWSSIWQRANLANYTTVGLYTTTVSPTPIPTTELVLPPKDPFGPNTTYPFPGGFIFGVAGSAAQIEGAVALEGRTPSIQETWLKYEVNNHASVENYFLYKQDIQRLASMGVKYYSFSISWTRILPFVLPGTPINELGIEHYNDLINTVLNAGMQPIVTMIHFDTPWLFVEEDNTTGASLFGATGYQNGGWYNQTFPSAFVEYGKILLTHFADRVPIWITFNEPLLYAYNFTGINNVVHCHSELYHFYHNTLGGTGKMGIKLSESFGVPIDPSNATNVAASNRYHDIQVGSFANPIFLGKQYPDAVLDTLPGAVNLTEAELAYMNRTSDFLGIDPYTATVISIPEGGIDACLAEGASNSLWPYCVEQSSLNAKDWSIGYGSESYVYITPRYFRECLNFLWDVFQSPVFVTEIGFPVFGESEKSLQNQLYDSPRGIYYLSFMEEILNSIWEDGVDVMGMLAWSFVDNFEFVDGYTTQFGIQKVNHTTQERYFKKSFFDIVTYFTESGDV